MTPTSKNLLTPEQQETLAVLLYIQENPEQIQTLQELLAWEARKMGWKNFSAENIFVARRATVSSNRSFTYEELLEMASIPGAVSYIDNSLDLCFRFEKTLYAGPVPVTLELFAWAHIPEEAEEILRSLGKIQDQITPASISPVVLCER